ncbi:transglutaminase family protein [Blastococcus sp. TML/M2B]|uniref:transglutaminase-like domain-containing protein n=1 Tax=unclassified Blastococcus TaxID=2619396 RepID=UPI00190ACE12|nr:MULTISPECIES: transglutaminase family protein [unclassified Blastococcus]MBN1092270.1 transglutaminase family protein [Blastococcus sp. TML/M2B]MBN1097632.1 transglutaminase family protein [Blastococcus sp. TML/C7B]
MEFDAEAPVAYLGGDDVIDVEHPKVQELVMHLAGQAPAPVEYARSAFTWVRDNIRHSLDAQDSRVTITASQTLHEGVGLCFAKAHLLAALLRARGIPTGLCYQRLADGTGYCVHGLIAVHVEGVWHRQDPRGNKPGVDAQFDLTQERLAWPVDVDMGEVDYPQIFTAPHPKVLASLRGADDALALCDGGLPTQL